MTPDMAVVTPLNNPGGPEGDTVTVDEQLLNTEYCHLRRVAYPEGTPPCLSTGNFYFLTLADIFSPEYFLPLCYRTPPYYWERTSSVCIMRSNFRFVR